MISEENKKVLIKRFVSLLWRIGGAVAALALNFLTKNLMLLELPEILQVILALVIPEITKYYNIDMPKLKAAKKDKEK